MSLTRYEYRNLVSSLSLLKTIILTCPINLPWQEEKKNNGADDSINLFLEQALTRQRDEMMENFSHILQHLPIATSAYSSTNHFGSTSPFKV
jgi:ATP sulfurylase